MRLAKWQHDGYVRKERRERELALRTLPNASRGVSHKAHCRQRSPYGDERNQHSSEQSSSSSQDSLCRLVNTNGVPAASIHRVALSSKPSSLMREACFFRFWRPCAVLLDAAACGGRREHHHMMIDLPSPMFIGSHLIILYRCRPPDALGAFRSAWADVQRTEDCAPQGPRIELPVGSAR
jgi:hypothetical protein